MKKVLVANRGEIAIRIMQSCKELGIETVGIYSVADREALHTIIADEAYEIGDAISSKSYLNKAAIIEVALLTNCDAIHPGYGFLSEDFEFRKMCDEAKLKFIGPSLNNMKEMGDKLKAKTIAYKLNIPIVPGNLEASNNCNELLEYANKIGFPIILKAAVGGGGKGIKVCNTRAELVDNFDIIKREAENSFGNSIIYIEKYIPQFKHIEVQIVGDGKGKCVHIGERLCTIQRNMQKIIEESPVMHIEKELRMAMLKDAVRLGESINYLGVGTVEFIYDHINKKYYFMEMNTRIQVEHPVTEMLYGVDLVKLQLQIADLEKLPINQDEIIPQGYALEFRINAEDANNNFKPSVGRIELFIPATGCTDIRTDTFIYTGYTLPAYYDSMIAKIIVKGKNRADAIKKMKVALDSTFIEGITTTIPFLKRIAEEATFIQGNYDNLYIKRFTKKEM